MIDLVTVIGIIDKDRQRVLSLTAGVIVLS